MASRETPFALVVHFKLFADAVEEFDQLVERTVARIRTDEPGTLVYTSHRDADTPSVRVFYELYEDRAAFEHHEAQEHVRAFLTERERMVESFEVEFLDLKAGKAPLNGTEGSADV
jgi:quinol monooxygenase YgiN